MITHLQPVELYTLLNERVRAHDLSRAGLDGSQCRAFLRGGGHRTGEQRNDISLSNAVLSVSACCAAKVSVGACCRLPAVLRGQRTQSGRYHCLARADITCTSCASSAVRKQ